MVPLPDTPGEIVFGLLMALLGGGGGISLVDAIKNRKRNRADTTAVVSDSAIKLVSSIQSALNEAQEDAQQARNEARQARTEAQAARIAARAEGDELWHQMHLMRREMEGLVYRFRQLRSAILDDNVSREELKLMAQTPDTGGTS